MVIAHTVILGQNNLNGVSSDLKLTGETVNDIPQSTSFDYGSAFRRNLDDIHDDFLLNRNSNVGLTQAKHRMGDSIEPFRRHLDWEHIILYEL
jgi:hypothetical protein